MPKNRGTTTLRSTRSARNPMREFDRLPCELREWVSTAALPWRARTVQAAYDKALRRSGDPQAALQELERIQNALLTKDAAKIWGQEYPGTPIARD